MPFPGKGLTAMQDQSTMSPVGLQILELLEIP